MAGCNCPGWVKAGAAVGVLALGLIVIRLMVDAATPPASASTGSRNVGAIMRPGAKFRAPGAQWGWNTSRSTGHDMQFNQWSKYSPKYGNHG